MTVECAADVTTLGPRDYCAACGRRAIAHPSYYGESADPLTFDKRRGEVEFSIDVWPWLLRLWAKIKRV